MIIARPFMVIFRMSNIWMSRVSHNQW